MRLAAHLLSASLSYQSEPYGVALNSPINQDLIHKLKELRAGVPSMQILQRLHQDAVRFDTGNLNCIPVILIDVLRLRFVKSNMGHHTQSR